MVWTGGPGPMISNSNCSECGGQLDDGSQRQQ